MDCWGFFSALSWLPTGHLQSVFLSLWPLIVAAGRLKMEEKTITGLHDMQGPQQLYWFFLRTQQCNYIYTLSDNVSCKLQHEQWKLLFMMTHSFHQAGSFHILPKENACISSAAENVMPHFLITLASPTDWALRQNKKRIFVPSTLGCLPLLGLAGLGSAWQCSVGEITSQCPSNAQGMPGGQAPGKSDPQKWHTHETAQHEVVLTHRGQGKLNWTEPCC